MAGRPAYMGSNALLRSPHSLIDENIGYLYKRLSDSALSVRKNTLMVLTHLTLNGMVRTMS